MADVSDNKELTAVGEGVGTCTCAVRTGDCMVFVGADGAMNCGLFKEPLCRVTGEVPGPVTTGGSFGRCLILVMTISANRSG